MTGGPVSRAAELATLGLQGPLSANDAEAARAALANDRDPRVRAAALGALVRSGPQDACLAAWEVAARDETPSVRRRAAELAPQVDGGAGVAPTLMAVLEDGDVTVVEAAAWALGELGAPAIDAGAVPALARIASGHDDPIAREAAVAALGALGDPAGLPAVLAACTDRPAVRRRAVLALAPFQGADVDEALAHALTDKDWQVRQAAEDLTR